MAVKPLPKSKLNYYKKILLKEKETTLKIIANISKKLKMGSKNSSGDLSSFSIHQADLGTDTANMEKEVYLLDEEQNKLKLLNRALGRIYDKSYGICEITGKYISEKRLKTIPWAHFSLKAKEEEEKRRKKHLREGKSY